MQAYLMFSQTTFLVLHHLHPLILGLPFILSIHFILHISPLLPLFLHLFEFYSPSTLSPFFFSFSSSSCSPLSCTVAFSFFPLSSFLSSTCSFYSCHILIPLRPASPPPYRSPCLSESESYVTGANCVQMVHQMVVYSNPV